MKDFLRVADLTSGDLATLLSLAAELKAKPFARAELLRGEVIGLYFAKPSTRTRLSFAGAVARLGGVPQVLGPTDLQLGRGETIEDTARVASRYCGAFVIRTFAQHDVEAFAAAASIPTVNALTDEHHPCQALADLLTVSEHAGALPGRTIAYVGDGNNVTHSLLEAGALAGMRITVGCPPSRRPDPEVIARATSIAATTGGTIEVHDDPIAAVRDADVVYTDVWLSMGDSDADAHERRTLLWPYQVNERLMEAASPTALFLHCLPAHRGEEVTAEVIDGPRSVVFDQAENRLCTAQAVLVALREGLLTGTRS